MKIQSYTLKVHTGVVSDKDFIISLLFNQSHGESIESQGRWNRKDC